MINSNPRYATALRPALGLVLLLSIFVFMLIVVSVVSALFISKIGVSTATLRIQAVLQDTLMFILPPVVTALLLTRYPAELLEVMRGPKPVTTLWAIAAMLAATPAMNTIIEWNAAWPLPDNLNWMRDLEEQAQQAIELMMGAHTPLNLIVSILVIGALTALGEELFFRSGIQKLLICAKLNPHAAIWITAFLFSAFHMQVLGFVPRMLLGAFFGYTMVWSGSVWLPVILHALNNSIVVVATWMANGNPDAANIDSIGAGELIPVVVSALLTVAMLALTYKSTHTSNT